MKLFFLSLLFILFFQSKINAEVYGPGNGQLIINTLDGGYAASGKQDSNLHVVKIDSTGLTQWIFNFPAQTPFNATSIAQTTDSGFIIFSTSDTNFNVSYVVPMACLIKVDKQGIFQWNNFFEIGEWGTYGQDVAVYSDGYLLTIYNDNKGPANDSRLVKTDWSGNFVSEIQVGGSSMYWNRVFDSQRNIVTICPFDYASGYNISITDSSCNSINSYFRYDTLSFYNLNVFSICNIDSGYLVAGSWQNGVTPYAYFAKFDFNLGLLWERYTLDPFHISRHKNFNDGFAALSNTNDRLYRFNANADTLSSFAVHSGANYFEITMQGGFIFTGDSIGQL